MKLQSGCLEERVFEIVKVPEYAAAVKRLTREADAVVHILSSLVLDIGQKAHYLFQKGHLCRTVLSALTGTLHEAEKRLIAKVLEQVIHTAVRHCQYLGDRQSRITQMTSDSQERAVLIGIGTLYSHHRVSIGKSESVIYTVRACRSQSCDRLRLTMGIS